MRCEGKGGDDILERRLLGALVLTLRNLASSNQLIKSKATVDATGYVVISIVILYCNGSKCM